MVRRRIIPFVIAGLIVLAGVSCRQVPDNILDDNQTNGHENTVDPATLAEEAETAFQTRPRTLDGVKSAFDKYSKSLGHPETRDYETLWKAARVAAWLGEYVDGETAREEYTRDGLTWANTALKRNPDGREGAFYHGVLAGFLGELNNSYGMDAVEEIQTDMEALIDADYDIAHAGPWRVYGVLLMRAPGPPTSVGSLRNARKMLDIMLEKAPGWLENQLYYAEFEFRWGDDKDKPEFIQSAQERLQTHFLGDAATPPKDFLLEFRHWRKAAKNLLAEYE